MIQTQQIRKTALWMGVVLPLAALLATVWVAHETNGEFSAAFNSVTQAYKVLNTLAETQKHISEAETGRRGWLLTGRKDYFELHDASMAAFNNDIQQLKVLARESSIQQANLIELQNLVIGRLAIEPEKIASGKINFPDSQAVKLTDDGWDMMNEVRVLIFQMREQETGLLAMRQKDAESKFIFDQTAQIVMAGVTAIALIAIITILVRLEKLRQIVTVCAWTGQVKYEGEWIRLDDYLERRFGLSVSHGLSMEAAEKMKREIGDANRAKDPPPEK